MVEKSFTFFPVNNGQSVLITLDDTTHLLFDLKQRCVDEKDKTADVHAELLRVLPTRDGRRWIRVFCLSHADRDHCQGFERVFYVPDGDDDDTLIGIDELWVTARLFTEKLENSASAVQTEAHRRLKLWTNPNTIREAELPGNRLVVFGNFDHIKELERLPESQRQTAGNVVTRVAGRVRADFEFFVHCPFKFMLEDNTEERNDLSLVGQVVVKNETAATAMLIGGDAGCRTWRYIYFLTAKHKNMDRLRWNIFFIPHHGTYGFFTEKTGEEGREEARDHPAESSMNILNHGEAAGFLVCSSRPVREGNYDDDGPPHIEAIGHYRNRAIEIAGEFICLMQHPNEENPRPLILRLTPMGPQRKEYSQPTGVPAASSGNRWG